MRFWGVEVTPENPYVLRHTDNHGRCLHLTQATFTTTQPYGSHPCELKCQVGSKMAITLCRLLPSTVESCPLDLEFEEDEDVTFSVGGANHVHLTGYYYVGSDSVQLPEPDHDYVRL